MGEGVLALVRRALAFPFLLAWSGWWLPFLGVGRGAAGFGFSLSFGLVGRRKGAMPSLEKKEDTPCRSGFAVAGARGSGVWPYTMPRAERSPVPRVPATATQSGLRVWAVPSVWWLCWGGAVWRMVAGDGLDYPPR